MNLPRLIAYANAKHAYAMANLHPAKGWLVGWFLVHPFSLFGTND